MLRVLFGSFGWPCGIHDVASYVRQLGLADVKIIRVAEGVRPPWGDRLRDFEPHVVGLRLEAGRLAAVRKAIYDVRNVLPRATVVLGGPTATSHPAESLEATGADYVFAGDAEDIFARFLAAAGDRLKGGHSRDLLPDFPGLAYRWGDRLYVNLPPEDPAKDRDWPCVSREILRENRLDWSLLEGFADSAPAGAPFESVFLTAGRGCPGGCAFCTKLHGRNVRTKPVDQLIEEIVEVDRLVGAGRLPVSRWPLFEHVEDPRMPGLPGLPVRWLSIFDEDFFLDRDRATDFFRRFAALPHARRYRLSFQSNPRTLLVKKPNGSYEADAELFAWIDRLKPMIQLGAESFHPDVLRRWNKRHTLEQLETVLEALDATRQDYTVFHIQADYFTTPGELRASTRLLLDAASRHRRMRIASSPLMIPLYDTDIRRQLTFSQQQSIRDFTDYERPHPEWLAPSLAEEIDRIDEQLQHALHPQKKEAALQSLREEYLPKSRLPEGGCQH